MGANISRIFFLFRPSFLFVSPISDVFRGIAVGLCASASLKRLSQHTNLEFSGHLVKPRVRRGKKESAKFWRSGGGGSCGGRSCGGRVRQIEGLGENRKGRKTNKGKHGTKLGTTGATRANR